MESLKSAEKWQCSSVFKMESRKLPPCSTEAMVGRPKDRQRELRPDKVHCRAVRLGPLVSKARCQPLDVPEDLRFEGHRVQVIPAYTSRSNLVATYARVLISTPFIFLFFFYFLR